MKNWIFKIAAISLIAVAALYATVDANGVLRGYTYDTNNNLIPSTTVKMEGSEQIYYATSDANGYYSKTLPSDTYIVTAYRGCISSTRYDVYSVDTVYVPDVTIVTQTTTSIVAYCY